MSKGRTNQVLMVNKGKWFQNNGKAKVANPKTNVAKRGLTQNPKGCSLLPLQYD